MSAKQPQPTELVVITTPKPTVLRCMFPEPIRLHENIQNVVPLQVVDALIVLPKKSCEVINDIIISLQELHSQEKLIKSGTIERKLLELHVHGADLLDRALAPLVVTINSHKPLRASYLNRRLRLIAA